MFVHRTVHVRHAFVLNIHVKFHIHVPVVCDDVHRVHINAHMFHVHRHRGGVHVHVGR